MGSVTRRVAALEAAVQPDGPDPEAMRRILLMQGADGVVRDGTGAAVDLEAVAAALAPHGLQPIVLSRALYEAGDRNAIRGDAVCDDEGDEEGER